MKTIIAGTDFSKSSINACKYAAALAQKLNCKLTIFNLFEAPILHSNSGMYGITYSSVRRTSDSKTTNLVKNLSELFPDITITSFVSNGSFKEELDTFTSKHLVEVVVVGLETKTKLNRFIYGSHGVEVAGKIDAPVIIVPEKYKKHKYENVLLTVDNNEKLHKTSLTKLESIVKQIKANMSTLHVRTYNDVFHPVFNKLKFNGKKLDIEVIHAKNLTNGLKNYSKDHPIDLTVVISKKHSVFYNLFSETNTKKIAFATSVPVMAIHE